MNSQSSLEPVCHIVTPIGMLGYGLDEQETAFALQSLVSTNVPTALILDSGSTDGGPSKLALGTLTLPRSSYVRDLTKLLRLANGFKVPLIFSSAGGDGSDDHVREMLGVIEEIASQPGNEHYNFKTIAIFSEIEKSLVLARLDLDAISGCGTTVPKLTTDDVESVPRIASQMGPEPFIDAMVAHPDFDIIVGGRAYDPSPYVAFAAFTSNTQIQDTATTQSERLWGGFTHMGKIMECGGICATPKSHGAIATVYKDGTFDIRPTLPEARCTPLSVAAHTLYEKSRPDLLSGPGGVLHLTRAAYEQLDDDRTVRVCGGLFRFSRHVGLPYRIKLEGAKVIGYRSMYMGSLKDPILIRQLDSFLERAKAYAQKQHADIQESWELDFHVYGQNQISALPEKAGQPSEIFLIGEALAPSQDLATSVISAARIATIHGNYPGQKATSGNFAYGLAGKMDIETGPCAKFAIYHLMDLKVGEERLWIEDGDGGLFAYTIKTMGHNQTKPSIKEVVLKLPTEDGSIIRTSNGTSESTPNTKKASPKVLGDISRVLRSKNAGPYEITVDIMFATKAQYHLVKTANVLNQTIFARLMEVEETDIIWSGFFDQALAFKVTIPRMWRGKPVANGSFMENDVHGSQKYLSLFHMKLPASLIQAWEELA
ncbi:hypothetical protein P154DRAFT_577470 [Amniculicola lignicola CBS 123094]|uniref:Caib baif family enzyme n=1 Tax=Amniculicola lignicola CBS 123094 TaxID=1392246 RepID=A0A6A5WDH5_9PLEO|nr:hypothetical protein P154DRAFT_577470 [Amniculicola lignicola CBS 123094]